MPALFALAATQMLAASGTSAPTFQRDIAPILQAHCIQCHRSGGIASVASFTSYETVRPWAKAIKEAVSLRQMPPWPPDPDQSLAFRNDARLNEADIATIRAWVDTGSVRGEGRENIDLVSTAAGWNGPGGRPPDLVISMTEDAQIPATGDLPYARFLAKVPFSDDKWIMASQARPGNASVVHHMAITEVEIPQGVSPGDIDGLEALTRATGNPLSIVRPVVVSASNPNVVDMLAIYTPGSMIESYGEDSGKLLRGGSNRYINFNIHYTANGRATTDRSEVAFWFRNDPPPHQIFRSPMAGQTILSQGHELLSDTPGEKAEGTGMVIPPIPPGAPDYELVAVTAFMQPVTIYQLHPHAHLRAKDFLYLAVYPDGHEQKLLAVPKYDFRWQMAYELRSPIKLPAGSKLVITAHYDNSPNNKFNPASDKSVLFRAQNLSTDEMFSPFVQYSEDSQVNQLPIVEAKGCLVKGKRANEWLLMRSTDPTLVAKQPSDSDALKRAAILPLGRATLDLLGVEPFSPATHLGQAMVVRGVLINAASRRLNVTSLQQTAGGCSE